jgi:S-adenosylmethionine decarboxylase
MHFIGTHVLADMWEIDDHLLKEPQSLMKGIRFSLKKHCFTVLNESFHHFSGGGEGVTGIFLLSESHCAFHTYPEFNYMAFDLFSCGTNNPLPILYALVEQLKPGRFEKVIKARGGDFEIIDHSITLPKHAII